MKKEFLKGLVAMAMMGAILSCGKDDEPEVQPITCNINATITGGVEGLNLGCGTTEVTLNGASNATGVLTYLWSNSATTPSITTDQIGTYTVTITDEKGCKASSQVVVDVIEVCPLTISDFDGNGYVTNNSGWYTFENGDRFDNIIQSDYAISGNALMMKGSHTAGYYVDGVGYNNSDVFSGINEGIENLVLNLFTNNNNESQLKVELYTTDGLYEYQFSLAETPAVNAWEEKSIPISTNFQAGANNDSGLPIDITKLVKIQLVGVGTAEAGNVEIYLDNIALK